MRHRGTYTNHLPKKIKGRLRACARARKVLSPSIFSFPVLQIVAVIRAWNPSARLSVNTARCAASLAICCFFFAAAGSALLTVLHFLSLYVGRWLDGTFLGTPQTTAWKPIDPRRCSSLSLSLSFQFFTSFNVRCGELQTRSYCCSSALTWLLVLQHLITVHRKTLSVSS